MSDKYEHRLEDVPGFEGLTHCLVCGGAEGALPTLCPGRRLTSHELDEIHASRLDYDYPNMRHGTPSWWRSAGDPTAEPAYKVPNDLFCEVCGLPQYDTPAGATCDAGHGGAEGVTAREKSERENRTGRTE